MGAWVGGSDNLRCAVMLTREKYLWFRDNGPEPSRQLEAHGWAVVPGVFGGEELARLRAEIVEIFESPPTVRSPLFTADDYADFRHATLNRSPAAQAAVAHPAILEVIEPLLGEDSHVIANMSWRNPPNDSRAVEGGLWHCDGGPHVPRPADVTIAVKLHYVDADRGVLGTDALTDSAHLRMIDPLMDPSEAYPHADGMISDFSSAPFDFMLLERPIVYYVPDMESFVDRRPLMYDLADVAVGPLCHDEAELTAALLAARERGLGDHRARYEELRQRFHTYPPGGASARVVNAIRDEFMSTPTGSPADVAVG